MGVKAIWVPSDMERHRSRNADGDRGLLTEWIFWASPPFSRSPMRRAWAQRYRYRHRLALEQYSTRQAESG